MYLHIVIRLFCKKISLYDQRLTTEGDSIGNDGWNDGSLEIGKISKEVNRAILRTLKSLLNLQVR